MALNLLLYTLAVLCSSSFINCAENQSVIRLNGQVNKVYNYNINRDIGVVLEYNFSGDDEIMKEDKYLHSSINVEVVVPKGTSLKNPLLVSIRQKQELSALEVPRRPHNWDGVRTSRVYYKAGRSLCPDNETRTVGISVSTFSPEFVNFTLIVKYDYNNSLIMLGETYNSTISPTISRYFRFEFPENESISMVAVYVRSLIDQTHDPPCTTISVQRLQCPVFEDQTNVDYGHGYQLTTTSSGGMTILREKFPDGFYLVLVVHDDDSKCYLRHTKKIQSSSLLDKTARLLMKNKNREQTFVFKVEPRSDEYLLPLLLPALLMAIIPVLIHFCYLVPSIAIFGKRRSKREIDHTYVPNRLTADSTVFALDEDVVIEGQKRSVGYGWITLIIGIVYIIPVVKHLLYNSRILESTGELDLCYYNYECAFPMWGFLDFNHVYSNIGYIILGFHFLIFVVIRQWKQPHHLDKDGGRLSNRGVLDHYGTFYGLAVALCMEGFMSGAYHVCPNRENFAFDTNFMYVISILCSIKLYELRHAALNPHHVFSGIAGIGILIFFSLFFPTLMKIVTGVIQIVLVGIFVWRERSGGVVAKWLKILFILMNLTLLVVLWLNDAVIVLESYILFVCIGNLVFFLIRYVILKPVHKEWKISSKSQCFWVSQPWFYFICAIIFWISGFMLFIHPLASWEVTPALSRAVNNARCTWLDFYDLHDLWHFLSAVGLYFTMLTLVTIDDDIGVTAREDVPVI